MNLSATMSSSQHLVSPLRSSMQIIRTNSQGNLHNTQARQLQNILLGGSLSRDRLF